MADGGGLAEGPMLQKIGNLEIGDLLPDDAVTDRLRSWQTRRYCQVKPSLLSYTRKSASGQTTGNAPTVSDKPDFAMTALLKCVLWKLDADLAMVSLLDDTTQYFIAGTCKSNAASARISVEASQWFGCDSVLHSGGLCEKTIRLREKLVYEEFNMGDTVQTKALPFVDGTLAEFKSYAGAPITTAYGKNIGTVFVMRTQPVDQALDPEQFDFLTETARQCMTLLEQGVAVLEHERMLRYNEAVTALMGMRIGRDKEQPSTVHKGQVYPTGVDLSGLDELYSRAAKLLLDSFGFDGVVIQGVRSQSRANGPTTTEKTTAKRLTKVLGPDTPEPGDITEDLLAELATNFLTGDLFTLASPQNSSPCLEIASDSSGFTDEIHARTVGCALHTAFADAQQLLFTPLWGAQSARVSAIVIGWTNNWSRVYSQTSDLHPMAAFCMALMTQVSRSEVQHLESIKSDFLGSVSHEMRSPLHGILASVELLLGTQCTPSQFELLDSALNSGRQLLDTIDQVLEFSQVSTLRPSDRHSANKVDFRELCERMISDAVTLLADPGSPLTPALKTETQYKWDSLGGRQQGSTVLISLDTSLPRFVVFEHVGRFRTILWNLLTNSLKYTYAGGIRVSLSFTRPKPNNSVESLRLVVTDSGRGMSRRYLDEHTFVPFSQARQTEAGLGLGLSLVRRTVDFLGGQVVVDSDESVGTTVEVELPLDRSAPGGGAIRSKSEDSLRDKVDVERDKGPILRAQYFYPFKSEDDPRTKQAYDHLFASLSNNLRDTLATELQVWDPSSQTDLIVMDCYSLEHFDSLPEEHRGAKLLILTPEIEPPQWLISRQQNDREAVMAGPLLPTRVQETVGTLFPGLVTSEPNEEPANGRTDSHDAESIDNKNSLRSKPVTNWSYRRDDESSTDMEPSTAKAMSNAQPQPSSGERRPKVLIVDDNAVNLKVLGMYMSKCDIPNCVAVDGGRAAIEAYRELLKPGNTPFDMIFMDLSMPDCDGFEATATIRKLEAEDSLSRRAEIIALTGLVSAKDQDAAFEAGVDKYLTKPAKIKDVRDRINAWAGRHVENSGEKMG